MGRWAQARKRGSVQQAFQFTAPGAGDWEFDGAATTLNASIISSPDGVDQWQIRWGRGTETELPAEWTVDGPFDLGDGWSDGPGHIGAWWSETRWFKDTLPVSDWSAPKLQVLPV